MKKTFFIPLLLFFIHVNGQDLQTSLQTVFNNNQLIGMSVVVFSGENQSVHNFGTKNFSQNLLIDNATKYRIASISKSFTALGLMKLYDQNLFQLDDDISTYLGYTVRNPNFPTIPITFRMLLTHTSSLVDGTGYDSFLSATYNQNPIPNMSSILLPTGTYYTADMYRNKTPGTYFSYANINFALIGTLIERISTKRFDIFMKDNILIPLGITGSFNIQDISVISDVATLYRKPSGTWVPQADNYNGVKPTAPDLSTYVIGTNGAYFAPQGGLRVSVSELSIFLKYIRSSGSSVPGLLKPATMETMKTVNWTYNGTNGNNYYGLFNKWGLGLHYANTNSDDYIGDQSTFGNFVGHTGEAYGLISDAFYSISKNVGFAFITNGKSTGYVSSINTFYTVENQVFDAICAYFNQSLKQADNTIDGVHIYPNPTDGKCLIKLNEIPLKIEIYNTIGETIIKKSNIQSKELDIDLQNYSSGIYIIKITNSDNKNVIEKIIKK